MASKEEYPSERKEAIREPLIGAEKTLNAQDSHIADSEGEKKDNKILAVVMMNFHALCITGTSATYRIVAEEGFHVVDFTLFRNLSIFTIASLWCLLVSKNPLKHFPWKYKHQLIWRIITG